MPLSPSAPPRLRGKRRSFHRPEVLNLRPVKSPNLYCACQAKRTPSDVGAGVIVMAFAPNLTTKQFIGKPTSTLIDCENDPSLQSYTELHLDQSWGETHIFLLIYYEIENLNVPPDDDVFSPVSLQMHARSILSCSQCLGDDQELLPFVAHAFCALWADQGVRAAAARGYEFELNDSAL